MDIEKLNEYSRAVLSLLLKDHPRWIDFAGNLPEREEAFALRIPSTVNAKKYLIISTGNDEITVAFDYFHDHIGLGDNTPKSHYREAKQLIESILTDELLVAVKFADNGDWESSTTLRCEDVEAEDEICDEYDHIIGFNKVYKGEL